MQVSPPLPHGNKNILTVERKKELKARTDVVKKNGGGITPWSQSQGLLVTKLYREQRPFPQASGNGRRMNEVSE